MQNSLRILVLAALLPFAAALNAQQAVHIICEGERLQFAPERDYWGEPFWEYSADERLWQTLIVQELQAYEIQPAQTGYYRLKLYDASCDSSFSSNVQFIEVRKRVRAMKMHSTHSGFEYDYGDMLFFWVDGEDMPEGVQFWVNQKEVDSSGGTDLLLPGVTESFTIFATAGHGDNCLTSDTLTYRMTAGTLRSAVPCELPYLQVQNLTAEVSEALGGALLSWDVIQGSKGCEIRYKRAGTKCWFSETVFQNNLSSYFLPETELYQNTDYLWSVTCGCPKDPLIAGPMSTNGSFSTGGVGTYGTFPEGTVHCLPGGDATEVVEVYNPSTGRLWMDRNLGARKVATALNTTQAFGDQYQWGRFSDGHQCRNSETTTTRASTPAPFAGNVWDGKFIKSGNFNWLTEQDEDLWQPNTGLNDPCPVGFRVPTQEEFDNERQSWLTNDRLGAFLSPLRFVPAGRRSSFSTSPPLQGEGRYWSSSIIGGVVTIGLNTNSSSASIAPSIAQSGFSVRCIAKKTLSADCDDFGGVLSTDDLINDLCLDSGPHILQFQVSDTSVTGLFILLSNSETSPVADFNVSGVFNMSDFPAADYMVVYATGDNLQGLDEITSVLELPSGTELSNPISFTTYHPAGGTLYATGATLLNGGVLNFVVEDAVGPIQRFGLLNEAGTQILTVQSSGSFDFDLYPDGTYKVVHAAYESGFNPNLAQFPNIEGCIAFSNEITVDKDSSIPALEIEYPANAIFCEDGTSQFSEIISPWTQKIWMDRNLGASEAATAPNDVASYGDLYQWGRFSDGHQCRNSPTTTTLSSSDQPNHGSFIIDPNTFESYDPQFEIPPFGDWRNPQNNNLWQKGSGINNPCPLGYRVPTYAEFEAEFPNGIDNNIDAAFNSPLKLPAAGLRRIKTGQKGLAGAAGWYWTSTRSNVTDGTQGRGSYVFKFDPNSAFIGSNIQMRGFGFSVRCIKDLPAVIDSLNCNSASTNINLVEGVDAQGVNFSVLYSGGNGGVYLSQTVSSSGVSGLTATLASGIIASGSGGSLSFSMGGIPEGTGVASFNVEIGGISCTIALDVFSCPGVENNMASVAADSSGFILSWDPIDVALQSCQVEYGLQNNTLTTTVELGAEDSMLMLPSSILFQYSEYRWRVRCICDVSSEVAIGPWSEWMSFNTGIIGIPKGNYPDGTVHCIPGGAEVVEVINPATGRVWMDRNLGASQVATSSNDEASYGDLYQWGRFSDGHQCRNSPTTTVLSSSNTPGNGSFIISSSGNWQTTNNTNLWQDLNSINNPCPTSYRIPTRAELQAELNTWSSSNSLGALNSPLKFPMAGGRSPSSGVISTNFARYWSSSFLPNNTFVRFRLFFNENIASTSFSYATSQKGSGTSVRCIQDHALTGFSSLGCDSPVTIGTTVEGENVEGVSTVVTDKLSMPE